jgi:hypothetical protein
MPSREERDRVLTLSDRTLRRYVCAWCDQSLYQAKRGNCGAIYSDRTTCQWVKAFKERADAR